MNSELLQMKTLASSVLQSILAASPAADTPFRLVTSAMPGDAAKPLLLVGNTHREFDDGYCIAIVNPDSVLSGQVKPGVAYSSSFLKEMVSGRCEGMVAIAFIGDDVRVTSTYRPRQKH